MSDGSSRPGDRVVLIGYRGCGKTTVGRRLAERLGALFHDTDEMAERLADRSIAEIFSQLGEPAFRELEALALREALGALPAEVRTGGARADLPRCVISTGGGIVLRESNRAAIRAAARCVWLRAAPGELHRRVTASAPGATGRPPLTPLAPLEEIERLLRERTPLYADAADHAIDTDGRDESQVVEEILAALRTPSQAAPGSRP